MYDKILNALIDYCDTAKDRDDQYRVQVTRDIIGLCHEIFRQSETYCERTPGAEFTTQDLYEQTILKNDMISVCEWEGAKWYEYRYVTNSVCRRMDTIQEVIEFMVDSANNAARYVTKELLNEVNAFMAGLFGEDAAAEIVDHVRKNIKAKAKMAYLVDDKEDGK